MPFPRSQKYHSAAELYRKGLSLGDLATYFNVTRQAMWKILKRRGVEFRPQLRSGKDNNFFRGTRANGRAQNLLEKALEKGVLRRQSQCEKCGRNGSFKDGRAMIQAHHCDYEKPLEVMWLCQTCHHQWHKNNKAKGCN